MSSPKSDNTTQSDTPRPGVYDTNAPTTTKPSGVGVYDAPSRAGGMSPLVIVGGIVVLLILAFLLFQFVF